MPNQSIKRVKQIIRESLDTHVRWLEYYSKHPEREIEYKKSAGDREHQQYCIAKYKEALKLLDEIECLIN